MRCVGRARPPRPGRARGPAAAGGAISDALRGELDPATDPPRASVGLSHGQFLLMPSEAPALAGGAGRAGGRGRRPARARAWVALSPGQCLPRPSEAPAVAGVKVVTVAPDNPSRGLPRIQGTYLLFDPETLAPRGALGGTAP